MDEQLLKEIEEETKRRVEEMSKDWNAKTFTPWHTYPYVYAQVFKEKFIFNKN